MAQDRQPAHRDRTPDADAVVAPGVPGKRTLTEALPVQMAAAPGRSPEAARSAADPWANAPAVWQRDGGASSLARLFGPPGRDGAGAGVVQAKVATAGGAAATADRPVDWGGGGGAALPDALRAQMEASFGADFSAVRIHTGEQAAALGARALTRGRDLYFAAGEYDPSSQAGRELIGHELAHVVQQSQGRVGAGAQAKGGIVTDDAALEREADELGALAARGQPAGAARSSGSGGAAAVQRKIDLSKCTDKYVRTVVNLLLEVLRTTDPLLMKILDTSDQITLHIELHAQDKDKPDTARGMTQVVAWANLGKRLVALDPRNPKTDPLDLVSANEFDFYVNLYTETNHGQAEFLHAIAHEMALHVLPHVVTASSFLGLETSDREQFERLCRVVQNSGEISEHRNLPQLRHFAEIAAKVRDHLIQLGHPEIAQQFYKAAMVDIKFMLDDRKRGLDEKGNQHSDEESSESSSSDEDTRSRSKKQTVQRDIRTVELDDRALRFDPDEIANDGDCLFNTLIELDVHQMQPVAGLRNLAAQHGGRPQITQPNEWAQLQDIRALATALGIRIVVVSLDLDYRPQQINRYGAGTTVYIAHVHGGHFVPMR